MQHFLVCPFCRMCRDIHEIQWFPEIDVVPEIASEDAYASVDVREGIVRGIQGSEIAGRLILLYINASEILVVANEQQLQLEADRCVLYAQFSTVPAESLIGVLKDAFSENEGDYVFEVGKHAIAIIKEFNEDLEPGEIEQYSMALCSTLTTEAGQTSLIGIGGVKHSLAQLHESLLEAKKAINIGLPFQPKRQIFNYSSMVLERFLCDIPEDSAAQFHQTLFNKKTAKLFSEEMLNTIEAFFDNSLNLSETARKLYIHRNTLVYRLDKIQKITGLDLRTFDDAMTFKLLMLMGKLRKDRKPRY